MTITVYCLVVFVSVWTLTASQTQNYPVDPSSFDLICNPYREKLELLCTIEEPQGINSPFDLFVFWYWTPLGLNPKTNSCQIYPYHRCDTYVGEDKYEFVFKRYRPSKDGKQNQTTVYRKMNLVINNVSKMDQGCYNCRPWLNGIPIPIEQSSDVFCLKNESAYRNMLSCSQPSRNISVNSSSSSSLVIPSSTPHPSQSTFHSPLLPPPERDFSQDTSNDMDLSIWLYLFVGLCIFLGLITCALSIIIIYLCREKLMKKKTMPHRDEVGDAQIRQIYHKDEIRHSSAAGNIPHVIVPQQSQYIGTYSLVQPHDKIEEEEEEETVSNETTPPIMEYHNTRSKPLPIKDNTTPLHIHPLTTSSRLSQDTNLARLSIQSPGSHIYQTLDKYMEELDELMFTEEEKGKDMEKGGKKDSYDRLFDDPNYSPLYTAKAPPSISSLDGVSPAKQQSLEEYDKLEPKPSDSEYAYAYAHMIKLRQRLRERKKKTNVPGSSGTDKNEEILRIAALGTYEMDPNFISTLRIKQDKEEDVTPESTPNSLPTVPPKIQHMKHTTEMEMMSLINSEFGSHGYQSLDRTKLTPDNSYTTVTK